MPAILVDTNVLVYAHDPADAAKHERAIQVLNDLYGSGSGHLSTQVLAEFFSVVTCGAEPRLTIAEAAAQVDRLIRSWPVLDVTPLIVLEATRGAQAHQLSYWDAQLWSTARLNQIPVILSEDFSAGTSLEGVSFIDPFVPGLTTDSWFS